MTSGNTVNYTIQEFLSKENILGELKERNPQIKAWETEIESLRVALKEYAHIQGQIIFEFGIPGFMKVIDVVILLGNHILVLEYKDGSKEFFKSDENQVLGYAYRLKYYHDKSKDKRIVPILVATDAESTELELKETEDGVYKLVKTNEKDLKTIIDKIIERIKNEPTNCHLDWLSKGIFKESPDIIQYITHIWDENEVEGLESREKGRHNIVEALAVESKINDIIEKAKGDKRKALVFVTGVPGAGKTLVGLNLAIKEKKYGATFLSGNGPLVAVLTAALVKNLKNKNSGSTIEDIKNKIAAETIIRNVYPHKEEIINRLDYSDPENYHFKDGAPKSQQHIVIYDEAQRAWSVEKMRKPGRSSKKWQSKNWKLSEPSLLLWDLDQLEWGVFVCLIGGGQEINDGETGLTEWLRTLYYDKDLINSENWDIYLPNSLQSPEYQIRDRFGKTFNDYLEEIKSEDRHLIECDGLHLTQCQRTPLSSELSEFINRLVEGAAKKADYDIFKERYPICITRNVETAKAYIRKRQEKLQPITLKLENKQDTENVILDKKIVRGGMLMSSSAARLRALGFPIRKVSDYLSKTPAWFLDTKEENIDSSDFLEVALNEFFVQGLEIDLGCVLWDGDFRYVPPTNSNVAHWDFYKFNKSKWKKYDEKTNKNSLVTAYMRNAYRVLLTRSRLGMVICVPQGDRSDFTRKPEIYNQTYEYLKGLGFIDLDKS